MFVFVRRRHTQESTRTDTLFPSSTLFRSRRIKAAEALSLGLVDAVVDDAALAEEALAFARRVVADGGAKPRIRDRADALQADRDRPDLFTAFAAAHARRFKGFVAPAAIIEAVEAAVTQIGRAHV